jgi:hypothetical protein
MVHKPEGPRIVGIGQLGKKPFEGDERKSVGGPKIIGIESLTQKPTKTCKNS